ncbi:MAG: hypothetical protein V4558_13335 [Gemmatimonadota bacterium]
MKQCTLAGSFLFAVMMLACVSSIQAQEASGPDCSTPGYYLQCALIAARIPELRDVKLGAGEREIRYWNTSGNMMPDRVLVLRQHGDTVSAQLLLVWIGETITWPFATTLCGERWSNKAGGLCIGRFAQEQDWRALLQRLDKAHLAEVPLKRVGGTPCKPPKGTRVEPEEHFICVRFDGFNEIVEVRSPQLYWRYDFAGDPDRSSDGYKRDVALLKMFRCASKKSGDGPCREP